MEYINNAPCGYECWSCAYCGKWTGNYKYREKADHICRDSHPTIDDGEYHDAICDVCGRLIGRYKVEPND